MEKEDKKDTESNEEKEAEQQAKISPPKVAEKSSLPTKELTSAAVQNKKTKAKSKGYCYYKSQAIVCVFLLSRLGGLIFRSRKKNAKEETPSRKITEFFPVRRSSRKTESEVKVCRSTVLIFEHTF